jgi:hypothetical protein
VNTGFPEPDAAAAFDRARRHQSLAALASRLGMHRPSASALLSFDHTVAALGRVSEHDLGLKEITLDSIIGTVSRRNDEFDRLFRPRTRRLRGRWQRIAAARRRGETMPPIDVYRIGDLHFVKDGHHRVSVARAHGDTTIDARVRQVKTTLAASTSLMPHEPLPTTRSTRPAAGRRPGHRLGLGVESRPMALKLAFAQRGSGAPH